MDASTVALRGGAVAAAGGGVVLAIGTVMNYVFASEVNVAGSALTAIGHIVLVFAFLGLLVLAGGRSGPLAITGFVLGVLGTATMVGGVSLMIAGAGGVLTVAIEEVPSEVPAMLPFAAVAHFGFVLGFILLAVAALRSGAYPRPAAVLLLVANVLIGVDLGQFGNFYVFSAGVVLNAVALGWLAVTMWGAAATVRAANPTRVKAPA
ncbi:MAG: hypothetical protein WD533_05230 [Dehalococcoidia bacterium]